MGTLLIVYDHLPFLYVHEGCGIDEISEDVAGHGFLDHPPLSIRGDESSGREAQAVGRYQRPLLVAEVRDRELPDGAVMILEPGLLAQNSLGPVGSGDAFSLVVKKKSQDGTAPPLSSG